MSVSAHIAAQRTDQWWHSLDREKSPPKAPKEASMPTKTPMPEPALFFTCSHGKPGIGKDVAPICDECREPLRVYPTLRCTTARCNATASPPSRATSRSRCARSAAGRPSPSRGPRPAPGHQGRTPARRSPPCGAGPGAGVGPSKPGCGPSRSPRLPGRSRSLLCRSIGPRWV